MMAAEHFRVKKSGKLMGLAGCYTVAQTKAAMLALSSLRETGKAKVGKYSIERVEP